MRKIKKIISSFKRDTKLKNKLLISHLLLVLLPTVIVLSIFYRQFYDPVLDSTITSEQTRALQGAETLEALLQNVEHAAGTILAHPVTGRIFEQGAADTGEVSREDFAAYYDSVRSMIDKDMISDIRIYYDAVSFDRLKYANTAGTPIFKSIGNITDAYWYGIFSTKEIDALYCPSLYLSFSELRDNAGMAYICRVPASGKKGVTAAYIAVYFSDERIAGSLKKSINSGGANYIVNERSVLVASSDFTSAGVYFMTHAEILSEIGKENTFVTDTFLGRNIYIGYQRITSGDWFLVSAIPVDDVRQKGQNLVLTFLVIYLFFALAAFFFAYFLSGTIGKRLGAIVWQMKKVRDGKPELLEESQITKDEIGEVADTYNYMTRRIHLLMEEQEEAAREMRMSEFRALQAQINPHFLYNTLDMINWLIRGEDKASAVRAVQTLSRFYKLTLGRSDVIGPLSVELEHVSLYVELQNMRYDNRITFVVDIGQHLLGYHLPRLTFQPIVENAILHGIAVTPDKRGSVVITGWEERDDLVFLISDDGAGMEETAIREILTGKGAQKAKGGIGVYNTHRRLQLLYGSAYGLTYKSRVGVGTEVYLRIPKTTDAP